MQSENKLFDDFVKMVNGVAGTMAGMGREAEASAREKMREWMAGADFVGRDEFEAVKAMAAAARDENEALKARSGQRSGQLRVSDKGGVSVYGLGRFPVTLYKEQWRRLLDMADEIRAFIREHESELKSKD